MDVFNHLQATGQLAIICGTLVPVIGGVAVLVAFVAASLTNRR